MKIDRRSDVLLVVDMQVDHVRGSLAHLGGPEIVEPINALAEKFDHIVIIKDWHPVDHVSFKQTHGVEKDCQVDVHYGKQWVGNPHCVQGTPGAELDAGLRLDRAELVFLKGYVPETDSYGAFHMNDGTPTGLAELLRVRGYKRVFGTGLGRYGCVGQSLSGAVIEGFDAFLIMDCTASSLDGIAKDEEEKVRFETEAAADIESKGVVRIYTSEIEFAEATVPA